MRTLADVVKNILLWQRDAPHLSREQKQEMEDAGYWDNPAGKYLIDLSNTMFAATVSIDTLADRFDAAQPLANKLPEGKKETGIEVASLPIKTEKSEEGNPPATSGGCSPLADLDRLFILLIREMSAERSAAPADRLAIQDRRLKQQQEHWLRLQQLRLSAVSQCKKADLSPDYFMKDLSEAQDFGAALLNYRAAAIPPTELEPYPSDVQFCQLLKKSRLITERLFDLRALCFDEALIPLEMNPLIVAEISSPPVGSERGEEETPPTDPYAALVDYARDKLKGQERTVIEALCASKGKLPIADLAILPGVGWEDPFEGYMNLKNRLNRKLRKSKFKWMLSRFDNNAMLKQSKGRK